MFKAFENDTDVLNINGDALTVTNGAHTVTIAGEVDITRDKRGLRAALALKEALDAMVAVLQTDKHLPEHVQMSHRAKQEAPITRLSD